MTAVLTASVGIVAFIVGFMLTRLPPPRWRQEQRRLQAELDAYRNGEKR